MLEIYLILAIMDCRHCGYEVEIPIKSFISKRQAESYVSKCNAILEKAENHKTKQASLLDSFKLPYFIIIKPIQLL